VAAEKDIAKMWWQGQEGAKKKASKTSTLVNGAGKTIFGIGRNRKL